MSLFKKYTKAWNESDISALLECHQPHKIAIKY